MEYTYIIELARQVDFTQYVSEIMKNYPFNYNLSFVIDNNKCNFSIKVYYMALNNDYLIIILIKYLIYIWK